MDAWQPMLQELAGPRYARLLAHAATLAGDRAAAEDLVQEALVRTFSRPRHFDSVPQAERYVRLAIASAFVDAARRSGREERGWRRNALGDATPDAGSPAVDTDVAAALASLPPRVRACLVLRFLEDLSTRETATALGLSEGAVKRYVSDGTRALAQLLGTSVEEPERSDVRTVRGD